MSTAPAQFGFYFSGDHGGTIPAVTPFDELPLRIQLNPEHKEGLRPTKACAERWLWFRDSRIAELTAFVAHVPPHPLNKPDSHYIGLLQAARRENPALIEKYQREYFDAFQWERKRYGNVYAAVEIASIQL